MIKSDGDNRQSSVGLIYGLFIITVIVVLVVYELQQEQLALAECVNS